MSYFHEPGLCYLLNVGDDLLAVAPVIVSKLGSNPNRVKSIPHVHPAAAQLLVRKTVVTAPFRLHLVLDTHRSRVGRRLSSSRRSRGNRNALQAVVHDHGSHAVTDQDMRSGLARAVPQNLECSAADLILYQVGRSPCFGVNSTLKR